MTDAKYFQTTKKGEIPELKADLNSLKEDKKKDAVKKVIALMTVGKDVSMLFTDVLKCITTTNLELKKLVYLYIMNYAKNNAENAILAVNTFHQDCSDTNPLIRALAIRTMGCLRVDKFVEYICEPLRNCLKDTDPYVAKTAAICVAKLYDANPQLVEQQGFLDTLRELLADSNPMVVSNAVAALCEIDEIAPSEVFTINRSNLSKLLTAVDDCTEWGQVFILNSLAKYTPKDSKEAQLIAERVTPRLQHANAAVVLSTVKILIKYIDLIDNKEEAKKLAKKMRPPLVTLLLREPEIQYVALRNINLILQKRPNLLHNEIKVFFCKYDDPLYVKMEKLEIMIMLANEQNVDQLLLEFKEYAMKVDVEFVRKAVRAIGRSAIKLEKAAEKCVYVLLDLVKTTKANFVVQEAIVVIKDIFRRYPDQYLSIISTLCEHLEDLDEPEAKASFIWIIGEYADRIETSPVILNRFLETFKDEDTQVQLQLLTAVVKLFLKLPKEGQNMVQEVLRVATTEVDNPDIRDRGFVYWRLLSEHASAAKQVVLAKKPLITDDSEHLHPQVLSELLNNISTLASVYHRPPSTFVTKLKQKARLTRDDEDNDGDNESAPVVTGNLLDMSMPMSTPTTLSTPPVASSGLDLFGFGSVSTTPVTPAVVKANLLHPQSEGANGLQIDGAFQLKSGQLSLDLTFTNHTDLPIGPFQMKFNTNTFNVNPTTAVPVQVVNPRQQESFSLPCAFSQAIDTSKGSVVQIALRSNTGVCYFAANLPLHTLFTADGKLERDQYLTTWKEIASEHFTDIPNMFSADAAQIQQRLESNNIFFVAKRNVSGQDFLYLSSKSADGTIFLMELALHGSSSKLCTKTPAEHLVPLFAQSVLTLLS
eukprot:TRINITY_DN11155_c0_g1_i1.p1 TRINITY_DN11155_c0_g1~~TRINITY_DN11155_c0_g1_i1.p1  ORF type:complete len:876 (-),score=234.91 TRINITY_DN11155_c0_g1_i1:110-2737(-)